MHAQLLQNEAGTIAANLNAGLAAASGQVVCRVDAKSRIPRGYVRRCVDGLAADRRRVAVGGSPVAVMEQLNADPVVGPQTVIPEAFKISHSTKSVPEISSFHSQIPKVPLARVVPTIGIRRSKSVRCMAESPSGHPGRPH